MNPKKGWLFFVVFFVGLVCLRGCDFGVPLRVSSTSMVEPVSTFTEVPVFASSTVVPNTATPKPTGASVPTITPTMTVTATPTVITTALPQEGYTFFGTQLKFLVENAAWCYTLHNCESTMVGVGNILLADAGRCPSISVPNADRSDGSYLLQASYYWLPPDSSNNWAMPYGHKFYLYKGDMIDPTIPWLQLSPNGTTNAILEGYNFVWEMSVEISEALGVDVILPSPLKIFPLSASEYGLVSSRPDLFPGYLQSAVPPRK